MNAPEKHQKSDNLKSFDSVLLKSLAKVLCFCVQESKQKVSLYRKFLDLLIQVHKVWPLV